MQIELRLVTRCGRSSSSYSNDLTRSAMNFALRVVFSYFSNPINVCCFIEVPA